MNQIDKIDDKSMKDPLLEDTSEGRKAMIRLYNNTNGRPIATNILLNHLIENIKRLDRTTTTLNIIMIFLTIILVVFPVWQFLSAFFR